jgi:glycosyltransferase involved in cell wall biosynthesis
MKNGGCNPRDERTGDYGSLQGVAILMCSHFGGRFIASQLDTIAAQSRPDWKLWVSDDHSGDRTLGILDAYRKAWGEQRLAIREGPGRGFCANFLSMACAPDIRARYYAYCDQDDLWDACKLATGIRWLDSIPPGTPALYCARTRIIDEAGRATGFSPLFSRPVGFRNALVQSVAGGNTMIFNNAARQLLTEAGADIDVQTHDWWTYIVVTACGGRVFYDPAPTVGYRQHSENLVGSNASLRGRAERALRLLKGRFRHMNDRNLAALRRLEHRMTAENVSVLRTFERAREAGFRDRVSGVMRSGVYCHTRLGNSGLIVATLLKKL